MSRAAAAAAERRAAIRSSDFLIEPVARGRKSLGAARKVSRASQLAAKAVCVRALSNFVVNDKSGQKSSLHCSSACLHCGADLSGNSLKSRPKSTRSSPAEWII